MLNYTRNFLKRSNTHSKTKSNTLEIAAGYPHLNRHSLGHCEEPFDGVYPERSRRAQDKLRYEAISKRRDRFAGILGIPDPPDPVGGRIKRKGSQGTATIAMTAKTLKKTIRTCRVKTICFSMLSCS